MEPGTAVALSEQESNFKAPLTLDEARERLRALLLGGERNAWEIGRLLNVIERSRLPRTKGYRKTRAWLDAEVPEAARKTSTLYRYANVAKYYSKAQADRWGIAKLYYLMLHDNIARDVAFGSDPAEREVQLLQADGSILTKKFRDCGCQEIRNSQRLRRAAHGKAGRVPENKVELQPQPVAISTGSMRFLKEQLAGVARRTQRFTWPFTRDG